MNFMNYAASQNNPPKGYGSIDKGIEVAMYRGDQTRKYMKAGMDYVSATIKAQDDVIRKYGAAK